MSELKCLKDVGSKPWTVRSAFMVENEAVCLTDGVVGLYAVDLVGIDVVADKGKVFVEEASPVVLREA